MSFAVPHLMGWYMPICHAPLLEIQMEVWALFVCVWHKLHVLHTDTAMNAPLGMYKIKSLAK